MKGLTERQATLTPHGNHGGPCGKSAAWWSVHAQMRWLRQTVLCRCLQTAAKTFRLAARRATGALEEVMVVPKVSPRRPPPEPNHLLGQLAHAGWASSLTATLCLPQVGQSKRETLVFERIRFVEAPARIRACKCPHIRGPLPGSFEICSALSVSVSHSAAATLERCVRAHRSKATLEPVA